MKLSMLHLTGFRAYQQRTSLSIGDLTAIIGRNDIGKSSLLEALDIVLGEGTMEPDDGCIHDSAQSRKPKIECEFTVDPDEVIVIDQDAETSWKAEYLLNEEDRLHVVWDFDCTKSKPKPSVSLKAVHDNKGLLQMKITELKSLLTEEQKSDNSINKASKVSIRTAIRSLLDADVFQLRAVSLEAEDGKRAAEVISSKLPMFRLFKSDRPSTDQDGEVQDPMKEAIKEAIAECQTDIDALSEKVIAKATDWANAVIAKLNELDPDAANGLTAEPAKPNIAGAFKIALKDQSGISINKRGSGVRRLVLLSFFRTAAERLVEGSSSRPVIYGVEEPETSQHPSNQKKILAALLDISQSKGRQVILTTHVPGLAAELPIGAIRFVHLAAGTQPAIAEGEEALVKSTEALGVLPDPRHPKLLFYVEGDSDVEFFQGISRMMLDHGEDCIDLSSSLVAFVPVGGSSLKHWVNKRHLESLGLEEMHVYDRDMKVDGTNKFKYEEAVNELCERGVFAELTSKREMENYIHPSAVIAGSGDLTQIDLTGLSYGPEDDVAEVLGKWIYEAGGKVWADLVDDEKKDKKMSKAKKRMVKHEVLSSMTPALLDEIDQAGDVRRWLDKARELASS